MNQIEPFLYGKYIILDRIAVGGMAEVFKAKAYGVRGFERLLVIKRILPHLSSDEEFVEMFIDEAKISVELNHANICQVTDLGKIDDNFFIAMEFVNGKDLRGILKKCFMTSSLLSIPACIYIVSEVCKGLDYAHRKVNTITGKALDVIHRDISPQNIMVSYHGDIKIVDFGIAKTASKMHKTQAGVLKGKFGYMSPEQAEGIELDYRTDIFSTGIILFEILSGQRLFMGDTDFETLEKIKNCNIPNIMELNEEVPLEVKSVIDKALAKEPDDRYESAMEMHLELSKILYNKYEGFSPEDLSNTLQDLFATEIKQENESLRRAIDSIAQEDLDRVEGAKTISIKRTKPSSPFEVSKDSKIWIAPTKQVESGIRVVSPDTSSNLFSKAKTFILFCVIASIPLLLWKLFFDPQTSVETPLQQTQVEKTAEKAMYRVSTDPMGVEVIIDGSPMGITPLDAELQLNETHRIALHLDGFVDQTIDYVADEFDSELYYQMEKIPPRTGTITVHSDPAGAEVFVDGVKQNQVTPTELPNLLIDQSYEIEVRKDGFQIKKSELYLDLEKESIAFSLVPMKVAIRIETNPSNAKVFVDGKYNREKTIDATSANQTYEILVKADGYETTKQSIQASDSSDTVTINLKKVDLGTGTLNVSAIPWAKVFVDGKDIGSTPIIGHKISVGSHRILLRHPDFPEVVKQVNIGKDASEKIIVDLRSQP
ncbi:MAG: serine/threonine-protein kinase [Bdellovibrionota bacterium]